MPTIYFDSSFYVHLRETDESTAQRFLSDLNELGAQLVLSRPLLLELLRSTAPDGDQQRLHSRIHAFGRPTLFLEEDLNWLVLLAPLNERKGFALGLSQIDGAVETTRSVRLLCESGSKEEMDQFMASKQDAVRQMGWLKDDGSFDLDKILPFLKEEFGFDAITDSPDEIARKIGQTMRQRFGDSAVEQTNQIAQVSAATLAKSSRPVRHAAGLLSQKAQGRLSRDYRDSSHINEFISHSDVINFLQLDSKQLRRVWADPDHPLHSEKLVERCFAADNLLDVIPTIRTLAR